MHSHERVLGGGGGGGRETNSLALGMFFKLVFPLFSSGTFCTYLCHFWWLDLLDFEEITQCQKSYCHSAYTDHKDHKRRSTADVNLQVLQQVYVEHYSDCSPEKKTTQKSMSKTSCVMAKQASEGVRRQQERKGKGELVLVRIILGMIRTSVHSASYLVTGSKFLKWALVKNLKHSI